MIAFSWTDAGGQAHVLDSPALIEAEYNEYCAKLLGLKQRIERTDDAEYLELRPRLAALRSRIDRLARDLVEYNVVWEEEVRRIAIETSTIVGGLMDEADFLATLHRCFEHVQSSLSRSSPPTSDQLMVLRKNARQQRIDFVPPTTFAEAQQLLQSEPALNREPLPESVPPFSWRDPAGHYHQIRSVSVIEKKFITMVGEIQKQLDCLGADDPRVLSIGIEKLAIAIRVINKLKEQMEEWSSFVIEADKRDMLSLIKRLDEDHGAA